MNLNSYLPLPTAPRAATPPANSPVQGPASGDAVAGQSLGLDFAQIMARQLQQLPASQRQSFAATSDAIHTNNAKASEHVALLANKDSASPADNQDKPVIKNNPRVSQDTPGHTDDKQESSTKSSSGGSQRSKRLQLTTKRATLQRRRHGRAICPSSWIWPLRLLTPLPAW